MIKQFTITGDCHGDMSRFLMMRPNGHPYETGVIILGDAGCNYYKNKTDHKTKMKLENTGMYFYLVRGNHEDRPENVEGMTQIYDENVCGTVYMQEDYPHIRYFMDGEVYIIDGHKTLVIGGAYSIDKWYRLEKGYQWFAQEQLTTDEMEEISSKYFSDSFDIILSHTCPLSWEPTDLFIGGIDQSKVDKSMETWLDKFKDEIHFDVWLFGHYHSDRLERPGVEMFYRDMEDLEVIWGRWHTDEPLAWWLQKSPKYDEDSWET